MARVTATEVKEILDDSALTDAQVNPYITGANIMVTQVLTNSGLGTDVLKEIERWLAAHMITVTRERTAKREAAGGASIEYTGEWGQNLTSTSYGQMVMTLDTTGAMAALGGKTASTFAIPSFE
jgi:hypothetical protein